MCEKTTVTGGVDDDVLTQGLRAPADPVLYERLVKRFQTPAQRSADGQRKGYARTLEASLLRSESRLSELNVPPPFSSASPSYPSAFSSSSSAEPEQPRTSGANDWDAQAEDGPHGMLLWRAFLEDRFVAGRDGEFGAGAYAAVDGDEGLDEMARRDEEDGWFESEEPRWAGVGAGAGVGERGEEEGEEGEEERELKGETGIQDF